MYEFPVSVIEFYTPKWMDVMEIDNPMKKEVIDKLHIIMDKVRTVRDLVEKDFSQLCLNDIFLFQFCGNLFCILRIWLGRVYKYHKRFSKFLKLCDGLFFSSPIRIAWYFSKATICCHNNSKRDLVEKDFSQLLEKDSEYIKRCKYDKVNIADGSAAFLLEGDTKYYYELLSSMTGENVSGEYQLMQLLSSLADMDYSGLPYFI